MELETHSTPYQSGDCKIICVREKKTKIYYAAKVLNVHMPHTQRKVKNEIEFLTRIGKDRRMRDTIAQFRGAVTWPGLYGFLMDYVAWPTLEQYLKKPDMYTEKLNAMVLGRRLYWILHRLHYIHHIIHRDIKTANIFVNPETKEIKLVDYGLAKFLEERDQLSTDGAGTPLYSAPEVLVGGKPYLLCKIDTFSAGMVIWETAAGRHPFEDEVTTVPELMDIYLQIRRLNPDAMPGGVLRELLSRVLQFDYYMRPNAAEAFTMFLYGV